MINHVRLLMVMALICFSLTQSVSAEEREAPHAGQRVANVYGFANWDQVVEIQYTFNTQRGDNHNARTWTWRPKEGLVTLEAEGSEPVTYKQSDINGDTPEDLRKVDHRFINDSYWLLFPFQLVWSDQTITDAGVQPLPIGEGEGRKLIVQYPDEGGYTPGDAYDIYLGKDALITHWVFRRGGGENGGAITWENNIDLGPIKVCTDHYNADKTFRLYFTDLKVTTEDGVYESE